MVSFNYNLGRKNRKDDLNLYLDQIRKEFGFR